MTPSLITRSSVCTLMRLLLLPCALVTVLALPPLLSSASTSPQGVTANSRTKVYKKRKFRTSTGALASRISLSCRNPGTHQDVVKNPHITNNTNKIIPQGTTIHWSTSHGDKETKVLLSPLDPGEEITMSGGSAGNNYTCKAWYPRPPR